VCVCVYDVRACVCVCARALAAEALKSETGTHTQGRWLSGRLVTGVLARAFCLGDAVGAGVADAALASSVPGATLLLRLVYFLLGLGSSPPSVAAAATRTGLEEIKTR